MRPRALIWLVLGVAVAGAARRWLDVVEVRGRSMAPTLLPGDRLLVVRARPRVGDVVLAPDPRQPRRELIKRVVSIGPDAVDVRGDNAAASTDATVARAAVHWRAVLCYWPASRLSARLEMPRRLVPVGAGGEPACTVPEALIAGP